MTTTPRSRTAIGASRTEYLRQDIWREMERQCISRERLAGMIHMDRNSLRQRLDGDVEFRLTELIDISNALHMIIVIGA